MHRPCPPDLVSSGPGLIGRQEKCCEPGCACAVSTPRARIASPRIDHCVVSTHREAMRDSGELIWTRDSCEIHWNSTRAVRTASPIVLRDSPAAGPAQPLLPLLDRSKSAAPARVARGILPPLCRTVASRNILGACSSAGLNLGAPSGGKKVGLLKCASRMKSRDLVAPSSSAGFM